MNILYILNECYSVFRPQRPIVEFSIESKAAMKLKEQRLKRSKVGATASKKKGKLIVNILWMRFSVNCYNSSNKLALQTLVNRQQ